MIPSHGEVTVGAMVGTGATPPKAIYPRLGSYGLFSSASKVPRLMAMEKSVEITSTSLNTSSEEKRPTRILHVFVLHGGVEEWIVLLEYGFLIEIWIGSVEDTRQARRSEPKQSRVDSISIPGGFVDNAELLVRDLRIAA